MRVDEPWQDCGATEINHSSSRGNRDAAVGSDVNDSLAMNKHNLFGQHLAAKAVEHSAGANRDRCRSRGAFIYGRPKGSDTACRYRPHFAKHPVLPEEPVFPVHGRRLKPGPVSAGTTNKTPTIPSANDDIYCIASRNPPLGKKWNVPRLNCPCFCSFATRARTCPT